MSLAAHLSRQLEAEIDASRRVIERIPASMHEWRPHEKSFDTLSLANHIANLVSWGAMMLTTEELDFASPEMQNWKPPVAGDVAGVLEMLQENGNEARSLLEGMSDAELEKVWTMRAGQQVFEAKPRADAFSRWVLSHQSHHRGQLMVYLRLNDVALPGIFGPTSDEQGM